MAEMRKTGTGRGRAEVIFLAACVVMALTAAVLMWQHRDDFAPLLDAARTEWAALSAELEATLAELREFFAGNGPDPGESSD